MEGWSPPAHNKFAPVAPSSPAHARFASLPLQCPIDPVASPAFCSAVFSVYEVFPCNNANLAHFPSPPLAWAA